MFKRRQFKKKVKRLSSNKSRRILQIYRLKKRIYSRHRVGFLTFQQQ